MLELANLMCTTLCSQFTAAAARQQDLQQTRLTEQQQQQRGRKRSAQAGSINKWISTEDNQQSTSVNRNIMGPQTTMQQLFSSSCRHQHRRQQPLKPHNTGLIQSISSLKLGLVVLVVCAALTLAAHADYAQQSQQHQLDGGNYADQQQQVGQQQAGASKAKKIQIVYIKVPLAKLKPSLAGANDYGSSSTANQSSSSASTYAGQQQKGGQHDATETKSQGSQSDQQQQQLATVDESDQPNQPQQQQQSSFLIPMAVVQTGPSGSEQAEPQRQLPAMSSNQGNYLSQASTNQLTSHTQPSLSLAAWPSSFSSAAQYGSSMPAGGLDMAAAFNGFQMRLPQQQQQQQQQVEGGRRSRQNQSPMQMYQHLQQLAASPSVNHGINHGFMSSFLLGEKEKMTAAAMRITHQPASSSSPSPATSSSSSLQSAEANQNSVQSTPTPNNNKPTPLQQPQGSGGLMPLMMMPFSHMPDNMIGQAYNAAVGQALPIESDLKLLFESHHPPSSLSWLSNGSEQPTTDDEGVAALPELADSSVIVPTPCAQDGATGSPASMLSSPSTAYDSSNRQQQQQQHHHQQQHQPGNNNNASSQQQYGGGNSGTLGDAGSSHGTASSGSYGSNGPNQQDSSSSANVYQHSGSAFAGSAPSSGYGSGINSFGASVAFSDYPTGQSTGSGYGPPSQQASSSSNSNNLPQPQQHQHNHLAQGSQSSSVAAGEHQQADNYNSAVSQKLRQAKKTIIPIVVQVEHAILENNGGLPGQNAAYNAANQQPLRGNKYSAPNQQRNHRQLNNNKRGRNNNKGPNNNNDNQSYRNNNNNQVPYGAATNHGDMGGFGGASSDAQYINAANSHDINQITAQINAENAASAAAALAQADMAFGPGSPAYIPGAGNHQHPQMHHQHQSARPHQHQHHGPPRPTSQYASAMQSAASVLLANTHPVIQAAASGGLASVSKLGAKLGEMIALPSMQVPGSIASIGQSLPSALTSIGTQMGMQLNQAVQQVAKEHPTAHAFARQVAQHAGISLPNFNGQQIAGGHQMSQHQPPQQHFNHQNNNNVNQQQQQVAASNQQPSMVMSPQAQLQNLKLSIGQNLQSAAAQLIGASSMANAQSAATQMLSNPLSAFYPPAVNAALKQLSGSSSSSSSAAAASSSSSSSSANSANQQGDSQFAQSSSLVPVQAAGSSQDISSMVALIGGVQDSKPAAAAGKPATLKSKFFSFFQPPKFISSLLSWNDRADDRNDQGSMVADVKIELAANSSAAAAAAHSPSSKASESVLEPRKQGSDVAEVKVANSVNVTAKDNSTSRSEQQVAIQQQPVALSNSSSVANTSNEQVVRTSTTVAASSTDNTSAVPASNSTNSQANKN